MGAVTDLSDLIARGSDTALSQQVFDMRLWRIAGALATTPSGGLSQWTWLHDGDGTQGVAPGATPITCGRTTQGGMRYRAATGGRALKLTGAHCATIGQARWDLIDVLAMVSGLSGAVTTEQTVNVTLPARGGAGAGVRAAVAVFGQVGATTATISGRYTNQAGTPNRTAPAISIASGVRNPGFFLPLGLASGDGGVQSWQGLTLSGSTGAVGNLRVVLYRPIASWTSGNPRQFINGLPGMPEIDNDACLSLVLTCVANVAAPYAFEASLVEA